MDEKTSQAVNNHIEGILEEFSFESRRKTHPDKCPCYSENKPCHDIPRENLNCFLCFCPMYKFRDGESKCLAGNPQGKGKWFYHPSHKNGRIWDCSDCTFPNEKDNVRSYLLNIFSPDN